MIEEPHSPELRQARVLLDEFILARGFRPFRTEVCLHHDGLRVAGQADLLCLDTNDRIAVFDWKRSREIRMDNAFRSMQEPLENLPDCNYYTYALQPAPQLHTRILECILCKLIGRSTYVTLRHLRLNVYAFILEDQYGYEISSMYLLVVHPDLPAPRVICVPRLQEEVRLLVEHEVMSGRAALTNA